VETNEQHLESEGQLVEPKGQHQPTGTTKTIQYKQEYNTVTRTRKKTGGTAKETRMTTGGTK
jgi:hypothetical protein